MYKVTLYNREDYPFNGKILLDTSSGENPGLTQAVCETKLNEAGSFEYSILPSHPLYNMTEPLMVYVSVEHEGEEMFYGRILSVQKNPFTSIKQVTCEGTLAFFLDVEMEIDEEETEYTAKGYFEKCISDFNTLTENDRARHISVGVVDHKYSDETADYKNQSYTQIQSVMKSKILNEYDGFFNIRRIEGGEHVIDWLEQVGGTNGQRVTISRNVLSQTSTESGEDIFTLMRPVGKDDLTLSDEKLGNLMLISESMLNKYGRIIRTVNFSDEDTEDDLRTKANNYISKLKDRLSLSGEISFVDFHFVDGSEKIVRTGDVFTNISGYEGTKLTAESVRRDLLNPGNDKMTLKSDKDLMSSATASGANSSNSTGTSSGRSLSSSGSHWYKFYHESATDASLAAKNLFLSAEEKIEINAKEIVTHAESIAQISGDVEELNETTTTIVGTGLYQNKEHITEIAGKFTVGADGEILLEDGAEFVVRKDGIESRVGELKKQSDSATLWIGEYEGTDIYQNKEHIAQVAGEYDVVITKDPTTGKKTKQLVVHNGTQIYQAKDNGYFALIDDDSMTAALLFEKLTNGQSKTTLYADQIAIDTTGKNTLNTWYDEYGTKWNDYVGSGAYINRAHIDLVTGKYSVDENGNVHVNSGTALYQDRDGGSFGLYDEGNLTAGIVFRKLSDGRSSTAIYGDKIYVGSKEDVLDDWVKDTDEGLVAVEANIKDLTAKKLTTTDLSAAISNLSGVTVSVLDVKSAMTLGKSKGDGSYFNCYGLLRAYGGIAVDNNGNTLKVRDISISGNNMTIYYIDGSQQGFSKATTLRGTWSGGKYTVSADPATASPITTSLADDFSKSGNPVQCTATGAASATGKYVKQGIVVQYVDGNDSKSTGKTITPVIDASSVYNAGSASALSGISDLGIYNTFSLLQTDTTLSGGSSIDLWAGYKQGDGLWKWGSKLTITAAAGSDDYSNKGYITKAPTTASLTGSPYFGSGMLYYIGEDGAYHAAASGDKYWFYSNSNIGSGDVYR